MIFEPGKFYKEKQILYSWDIRSRHTKIFNQFKDFYWLRLAVFITSDTLMIYSSWLLAIQIVGLDYFSFIAPTNWSLQVLLVNWLVLAISGAYGNEEKLRRISKLFLSLTSAHILSLMAINLLPILTGMLWSFVVINWGLVLLLVASSRYVANRFLISLYKKHSFLRQKVAILTNKEDIQACKKVVEDYQYFQLCYVGELSGEETLSDWKALLCNLQHYKTEELIIGPLEKIRFPAILWRQLKAMGINLRVIDSHSDLLEYKYQVDFLYSLTTLRFKSSPIIGLDFLCKRVCDFLLTIIILVTLSPLLLVIAILIKLDSPGPVFFKQVRVGLQGRYFKVWKFRTMVVNAEQIQQEFETKNEVQGGVLFKIKNDPRITKIGKKLRCYSLDELPQLFNVLRGEMSLVGPRPLPLKDVENMSPHHHFRHEVLPGITGLWQVNGRSDVSSEKVFYWDQLYIQRWSLDLDLKILLKTILVVFCKKGAY